MPLSKAKNLSSLFHSAIKTTATRTSSSSAAAAAAAAAEDAALKRYVSSIDTSSSSYLATKFILKRAAKSAKSRSLSKKSASKPSSELPKLKLAPSSSKSSDSSSKQLSEQISSILCGGIENVGGSQEKPLETLLEIPWFANIPHNNISLRRKELTRQRKQKYFFKNTQGHRFHRLVRMCGERLGTDATLHVFGRLGRKTGVKEYNALIALCVEDARKSEDEEVSLEEISKAFKILKNMREQGFPLEDETYRPVLIHLIEMGWIEEFGFFCKAIKDENPTVASQLGYYEMRLWIHVNDEEKIKELCSRILAEDGEDVPNIRENYLLALCECDRTQELLELLEVIDIKKILSVDHIATIFKCLGRLSLESYAEKFILACNTCDYGAENISHFILNYGMSMPNLAVEEVIVKFKDMHAKLEVTPSSISYEKLVIHCCDLLKVYVALDIVDQMYEAGLTISIETFHSILRASEECCEFNLVHRIYSVICRHNLKPNSETFRSMITLSVKMKDYEGAYGMLNDLVKMNLIPTANMYNAIMAGYFREKNISGGLKVLKQMELADVKPDSQTFSYLLNNCDAEEDIMKYCGELKRSGVQVTKQIYMALINAYASCGQFEKAKQVALDKGIPVKGVNDIKSVLVSALASHGLISDALVIYEEIKQAGCSLEPRAIICLIEYLQSEGELSTMLQLLKELNDPNYWADGCSRVILYCVRYKHLSSAVSLLKQLKEEYCEDELAVEAMCDEAFSQIAETEPVDLQTGLQLLQDIKEKLELLPSRKSLDFLLGACVKAKDLDSTYLVWREYQATGLPYNVLSFLRMYQGLLASGDHKSAANMLNKIPKDDPHVRCIIKACQVTYANSKSRRGKKKAA